MDGYQSVLLVVWGTGAPATVAIDGVPGFFISGLIAAAVYQLLLALEVAVALVRHRAAAAPDGEADGNGR